MRLCAPPCAFVVTSLSGPPSHSHIAQAEVRAMMLVILLHGRRIPRRSIPGRHMCQIQVKSGQLSGCSSFSFRLHTSQLRLLLRWPSADRRCVRTMDGNTCAQNIGGNSFHQLRTSRRAAWQAVSGKVLPTDARLHHVIQTPTFGGRAQRKTYALRRSAYLPNIVQQDCSYLEYRQKCRSTSVNLGLWNLPYLLQGVATF